MKQEYKELLLKDLCSRLPYKIRCSFGIDDAIYEVCGVNPTCCGASEIQATHIKSSINGDFSLSRCKPYLFPLSSMTEEQRKELFYLSGIDIINGKFYTNNEFTLEETLSGINWLLKNYFDINGLIPTGLATDATNLNIY